eukprot:423355-Amphidinium_carterae.1
MEDEKVLTEPTSRRINESQKRQKKFRDKKTAPTQKLPLQRTKIEDEKVLTEPTSRTMNASQKRQKKFTDKVYCGLSELKGKRWGGEVCCRCSDPWLLAPAVKEENHFCVEWGVALRPLQRYRDEMEGRKQIDAMF